MTGTTTDAVTGTGAGSDRVGAAFDRARDEGRAALVVYLPAGYPDMDTSRACLEAAAEAGADVLEVGFPFSDPIMDGPIIQSAAQAALDQGYRVADDLAMCRELATTVEQPALVMTYVTIPDTRGYERFAADAVDAGLAGAILPDLPAGEAGPWIAAARPHGLATVFLASSVSSDDRLSAIAEASTGFVYAVGLLGVTGVKDVSQDASRTLVDRIRTHTGTPVAVGLGVKTGAQAAEVAAYADGVIVGSAVVQAAGDGDTAGAAHRVRDLVSELRRGVASAPA